MSLDSLFNALLVVIGVYVYVSVSRQIAARPVPAADATSREFGIPEAVVALLLITWFALTIAAGSSHHGTPVIRTRDLTATALISIGLVLFLAAFVQLRGMKITIAAGLSKIGFGRVVSTAAVLLFAAFPLIFLADTLAQRVLGSGSSKQEIVEMFNGSQTLEQRIMIIVLAVVVAPFAEEFMFRFFLYGVMRRYFGRIFGLLINGSLFAAVHMHLPSFGPLLVLAGCFTLAYEWSGSILVAMTMHALFNALSLVALAFPQTLGQ
jgi:membrane protease YdiL (CAAX protease family)